MKGDDLLLVAKALNHYQSIYRIQVDENIYHLKSFHENISINVNLVKLKSKQ